MSKDKNAELGKPDDPALEDAKKTEEASGQVDETVEAKDDDKLDEGLDESFPGSDAPSSTRRSSEDK